MGHSSTFRRRFDRGIAIAGAFAAMVLPTACGGTSESSTATAATAETADATPADGGTAAETPASGLVTPGEAAVIAADPAVTVIDVRTPEEFADGHLDGAELIDFYDDTFVEQLADLDPDGTYLVYCRSGNRSGQSTTMMAELGFDRVYDLDGGVIAWDGQGHPLVR